LEQYVGQTLELKIIELDRSKNNVGLLSAKKSWRNAIRRRRKRRLPIWKRAQPFLALSNGWTDFGAFVDIGNGVEVCSMCRKWLTVGVDHPSDGGLGKR